MRWISWLFRVAAVYGLIVLTPHYFLEETINRDYPPAITHPEYYYGFIGVAVAWQFVFLIIGHDPARYRLLILPSILEKATYGIAAIVLFVHGRTTAMVLGAGLTDLVLGTGFAVAYWKLGRRDQSLAASVTRFVHVRQAAKR